MALMRGHIHGRPLGMALPGPLLVAFLTASSCSSSTHDAPSTASLVSTCDQICSHVVAQCSAPVTTTAQCLSTCNDLNLAPLGCVGTLASYLTCLSGATSIQCQSGGQYILLSPPECSSDLTAVQNCNAPPGLVAACFSVPTNDSMCTSPSGPAGGGGNAVFCIGAPKGCAPPMPNPLGIGTYCCP